MKPIIDFFLAFLGLVLLSPLLILLAFLLLFSNKGNPFFMQYRPGKDEKIFKLIKFRTMNNLRDDNGILLPDHLRLTGVGKFVRSTSLDELPQLFNVVKGDMSLVGPRPLLVKYLERYSPEQKKRHNVKPGITGWAQVNGRNALSWDKKFELDVYYVHNVSLKLDSLILFRTIQKVIARHGITASGHATIEEFKGPKN